MLLITLRFYATGSFLQVVGDFIGIDKSTASRIVYLVSRAIASHHNDFLQMPSTDDEMRQTSNEFYAISRFPTCIGAIDCTHVRIQSPGGNNAETYRNRKGFFSFNVQAVCNAQCMFQDVVCRWPGSSHDANIFANSIVRKRCERGDFKHYLILGDSGYGVKRYLMTPLENPLTRAEILYNESQIRTRNPIERAFGIWKRRFAILSLGIRLKSSKVEAIVIATAILHNIAIMLKDPEPFIQDEDVLQYIDNDILRAEGNGRHALDNARRNQIINEYFAQL